VLGALVLVFGVVLGAGSWRAYVAEHADNADNAGSPEGPAGQRQGRARALVKPKEVIKPVSEAASTPSYGSGTRQPAAERRSMRVTAAAQAHQQSAACL
jgi:hypothetical protein